MSAVPSKEIPRHLADNRFHCSRRMGADRAETFLAKEVDDNDREHEVTQAYNIDGWTGFDFPGRKGKVRRSLATLSIPSLDLADLSLALCAPVTKYSEMTWNFNHFSGVDWDNKAGKKAVFLIEGKGKGQSSSLRPLLR